MTTSRLTGHYRVVRLALLPLVNTVAIGNTRAMTTPGEQERELAAPEQRRGRVPADTLANRLMLARALAGHLSIREAADLCGLGRGAWTKWERGTRPSDVLEIIPIIAEKLEIDEHWLLWGGPLEGPKGRPVRPVTKRTSTDTLHYPSGSVRPTSTRPMTGRPKTRTDRRVPNVGRPVIIDRPEAAIDSRLAHAA